MEPLSVMIVDDSALMRNVVGKIIEETPGLTVQTKAINGLFALKKLEMTHPDVIVLDLEMPEMNGIEFLKKRRELGIEIPVIILSSQARQGAAITMEALSLGACDFLLKPHEGTADELSKVADQLRGLIFAYGGRYRELKKKEGGLRPLVSKVELPRPALQPAPPVEKRPSSVRLRPIKTYANLQAVVIGISTGGPQALRHVFSRLRKDFCMPVLVVQHMPPGFTAEFAKSLAKICALEVKEAAEGDLVRPGRVLIAPGDYHMVVERKPLGVMVSLQHTDLVNGHRPSVGVLFKSALKVWGEHLFAIIMTGMGRDGSEEIGEIRRAGGLTAAQDAETSVVWGMPRVAEEMGNVELLIPLDKIADVLNEVGERGEISP